MKQFFVYKNLGFCNGVESAVKKALQCDKGTYCLGEIVHNKLVTERLHSQGIVTVGSDGEIPDGATAVIRAHGVSPDVYQRLKARNVTLVDATCPFVSLIQRKAKEFHDNGYQIVLVGNAKHPEIVGINGWCNNTAIVTDGSVAVDLNKYEKVLVMFQTTFDKEKYIKSLQNLLTDNVKTLEIFDTICYTTIDRQNYAQFVSQRSDFVVVVGDRHSSNTNKLFDIASRYCNNVAWVSNVDEVCFDLSKFKKISFISGASTPAELMEGVLSRMSEIAKEAVEVTTVTAEANNNSTNDNIFEQAVSQIKEVKYRPGKIVKCNFVSAVDNGVFVRLPDWKQDAFIPNEELTLDDDYSTFKSGLKTGDELECSVVTVDGGKITLSKKTVDARYKDDELVGAIKEGKEFELVMSKVQGERLIGKLGSYTVTVHASQIKMGFVKDLTPYVGKKLRLVSSAEKVDDAKHHISASQRAILVAEKKAKEDEFWNNIEVDEIVEGKVLRFAPFGAFVSVRGYDCLAHTSDLAWDRVNNPADVLEIGNTYEFVVLALDREKNRVSLGYKQLQPKPWELAAEKFAAGNIVKGKVARIMPYGAFIELDKNIDGLLHVSNVSWEWLDDINKALTVGDEIEVQVLEFDAENKRITLSRKAVLPKPEQPAKRTEDAE
ncbi:MAG TPA: 4-hydroxy-3-methylbut-2-enyl diphosphate reductase [Candidatus Limihabitans stercoravium]|nr:4-hydroxy-3-methylbut-2-enyl diphosphate reductase [Candidatus Limihabitans stercoravium]